MCVLTALLGVLSIPSAFCVLVVLPVDCSVTVGSVRAGPGSVLFTTLSSLSKMAQSMHLIITVE